MPQHAQGRLGLGNLVCLGPGGEFDQHPNRVLQRLAPLRNVELPGQSGAAFHFGRQASYAREYLTEIARVHVDRLSRYAQDPNPAIRADIADIVGFSDDEAGLPIVEALARDQDALVALSAQRAVARLRPDR